MKEPEWHVTVYRYQQVIAQGNSTASQIRRVLYGLKGVQGISIVVRDATECEVETPEIPVVRKKKLKKTVKGNYSVCGRKKGYKMKPRYR